jgi:uncharacterized protein (TIRG00374 family)
VSRAISQRTVRILLRLVGPVVLAVVILRLHDKAAVGRALVSADLGLVALAVALNLVNVHLKVVRWRVFLRTRGIDYPVRRAWGAFLSSLYVGMLTPGRVGDVLRVQYLRADNDVPYAEGLASVVIDRLCDLYVLAAFVAFGVARYGAALAGDLAVFTWSTVALIVVAPLALLVPGVAERATRLVSARFAKRDPSGSFTLFLAALRANVGKRLLVTIPLTVAAFVVSYLQGYLLARALHLDLGFVDATCLLAIANLLGLLPISISGMGVRELFFAKVFPLLGLAAASGVTFGLLVFGVIYLGLAAFGFVSWQFAPPPTAAKKALSANAAVEEGAADA